MRGLSGGACIASSRRVSARASPVRASPRDRATCPEELWARFDDAVERLNQAGAGDSLADLVAAYAAVADAAGALADALEAPGE